MNEFPEYKQVQVSELIPYARNSRTHSDEQVSKIAASIKEFGFLNPVITDGENGIVAGHGRVMAAQRIGMECVPTVEASHLTDAQKRAYIIADNRLALDAGWDDEMLRVEFADLEADGFDLELTGFTLDEIDGLGFEDDALDEMPAMPEGDREPFQQLTFTLHDEQVEQVKAAMEAAKALGPFDSHNENSNGNAIARVCETFLSDHGHS